MSISTAFMILGFCFVVAGTGLWSVPAALVLGGVLLLVAGVLLLERGESS